MLSQKMIDRMRAEREAKRARAEKDFPNLYTEIIPQYEPVLGNAQRIIDILTAGATPEIGQKYLQSVYDAQMYTESRMAPYRAVLDNPNSTDDDIRRAQSSIESLGRETSRMIEKADRVLQKANDAEGKRLQLESLKKVAEADNKPLQQLIAEDEARNQPRTVEQMLEDLYKADPTPERRESLNQALNQYQQTSSIIPKPTTEAEAKKVAEDLIKSVGIDPASRPEDVQYWADQVNNFGAQAATNLWNSTVVPRVQDATGGAGQFQQTQQPQIPLDRARQIAAQLITTAGFSYDENPKALESWANYISNNGVDAAVKAYEEATGVSFGLGPSYSQGKRYTYDTAKDLADTLFDAAGLKKTGFYDDGTSADSIYNSWISNSQYRPIEETIKLWNERNPQYKVNYIPPDKRGAAGALDGFSFFGDNRLLNFKIDDILAKETARQNVARQENIAEFFNTANFIASGSGEQQPFVPGQTQQSTQPPSYTPFEPNYGDFTTGALQGIAAPGTEIPYPGTQQPFYPEMGQFQPQQPVFQTGFQPGYQPGYQPQFQTPSATPLITQAQRPMLDQTVQFIESGGMSPNTGVQPMQPLSPYNLGSTFQAQTEPYFVRPDVATGIDQMTADQLTPTQAFPVTSGTYYGLAAPIPGQGGYTMVPTTGITPTAGMRSGGEVGGLKAAAQQLQSMGRGGDTMLAHITPQEAGLLKAMGGSGTINPKTGLREFSMELAFLGLMGFGTAMTIQEQRKQRKAFEAEQNRQRQERMQQLARGQAAYERSGLKDIPLESSPMRGATVDPTTKFDPAMGGVRVGEGVSQIPIPQQSAQTLQPPSTIPATPMMDEEERRRRGMAQGGMPTFEYGGTTGQTGEPRMVKGAGDGMSDNVPATIEGVQEARLANDEFVIPADVVADIGNGSSSSGAQKLYAMMDRVRKARHGTTEQPPEINAEQYMPS